MGNNRRPTYFLAISMLCLGAAAAVAGFYILVRPSPSTFPSEGAEHVKTVSDYFQPVLAEIVESDTSGKIKGTEWTFTAYGTLLSWDGNLITLRRDEQINKFRIPEASEKRFTRWSQQARTASSIAGSEFSPGDNITLSFRLSEDSGQILSVEIIQNAD